MALRLGIRFLDYLILPTAKARDSRFDPGRFHLGKSYIGSYQTRKYIALAGEFPYIPGPEDTGFKEAWVNPAARLSNRHQALR